MNGLPQRHLEPATFMPPLTFLHSADWQLGKPFAGVQDEAKRNALQQARFRAIERLGPIARQNNAAFLIVAGDLFDSPSVTRPVVSQACSKIGGLGIPVYVIPGNHDPGGHGSIWESEFFLREKADLAPNLKVLLTPEPRLLDTAVLLPCPLFRKHEAMDPTSWLRGFDDPPVEWGERPRIIIAHGSTSNFRGEPDDEDDSGSPNILDLGRLPLSQFDYVALGDWHGTREVHPKAWYPGTPEVDRFHKGSDHDPGNILVIGAERGAQPIARKVATSEIGWHALEFHFNGDADIAGFEERVDRVIGRRAGSDLLKLTLSGSLGIGASAEVERLLESLESRLIRLKLHNHLRVAPEPDEIAAMTMRGGDPLIAGVARRLNEIACGTGEEAEIAQIALRELHAQIKNA